jgi:hypothetical protein
MERALFGEKAVMVVKFIRCSLVFNFGFLLSSEMLQKA